MPDLPSGTVTFLFTDIEGSTALAQQFSAEMPALLARHHAILQQAIQAHNGHVFQITGDAFCAAFHTANDALMAALDAQRGLQQEAWNPAPIKVRMGLHTGVAQAGATDERAGGYVGYLTLTRVQRVMSVAYGGQVLLSNPTAELVRGELPAAVTLRDMGEHRLKGLLNPEHLWQLVASDLREDFPPLLSLNAIPNNLPVQLTSFIGREKNIAEVKRLLSSSRLVTLTGSGGAGKTRLSLQVAAEVIDDFTQGVWFVELAPLTDPALIPQTIASVLGLREEQGRPLMMVLTDYLRGKTALIILDNCEHLIEGCAQFADTLLRAAPQVKFLASSREALDIGGEATYRVPSLAAPDPQHIPSLEVLTQYDAVRLFIERAKAVLPSFEVNNANAPAVAQLCYHLDGIPLAIELAAARVRGLKVEQIAQRLGDRFRLLTGGGRTALPHHQTLRTLIDWSHSLLTEQERSLFRRLSVFASGWSIEAAETVCASAEIESSEVLDVLLHLVDKSLVIMDEQSDETRYRMLETIREYAIEKLFEAGEAEQTRGHHFDFFFELAETAQPFLEKAEQANWLDRLEREHDNLRAALGWANEKRQIEPGARLAEALCLFWFMRGYLAEGRERLTELLALQPETIDSPLRARLLNQAGFLTRYQGEYVTAYSLISESLAICRRQGDRRTTADALANLGFVVLHQNDYAQARALYAEALTIQQELDNKQGIADSLSHLALISFYEGDYETARHYDEESLILWRNLEDRQGIVYALQKLGNVIFQQGNSMAACDLFRESLVLANELGSKWGMASAIEGLASAAAVNGQPERALRLAGAAAALRQAIDTPLPQAGLAILERTLASARQVLGDPAAATAWAEGQAMELAEMIHYALEEVRQD